MRDIAAWLAEIGLAKHGDTFRANAIDFDVLSALEENDLKELGLPLGDRKRLLRAISALGKSGNEALPSAASPERRQLTVLFADLVGSTALSQALDPEDLRDVMLGYHEAVAAAIRDGGGFVAKFMGDGVLAYFGYPQATEDAAERAVRASLRALDVVRALPSPGGGRPFAAKVGVATGPVVVGDVVGDDIAREVNVVGETPNLAARLLGLGAPNSVVIAESTRRIVGDLFTFTALAPQTVKGFAEPVRAFEVVGERHGVSRFEATRNAQRSRFVGRGQEVGLLLDRWEQAKAGDGQLVLLSGEAGIGKSRIAETMVQQIQPEPHHRIRYQCTPQHTNSPLYPAVMQLATSVGFQPEDDMAARTARIRMAMPDVTGDQIELVASLLGVPLPKGSPLANLTPARRRQLILDAFTVQLEALCHLHPVLWVIEDTHWIDPTTEELISRVVERTSTLRLLIVVTHRPTYASPWTSAPIATPLTLNRLSRTHAGALLGGLGSGKSVPTEALEYILDRTDGVPLYMEEFFQALRDSGALRETDTAFEVARALEGTAVPATLQDALMARLDRLVPGKAVAQLGAAIGREFELGLLSAIADLRPEALSEGLRQLLAAGLIFERGSAPETIYTFKHALVQDAAHSSMLKQRRQAVHGLIARASTEGGRSARPEILAHHFEAAGEWEQAATWLDRAGEMAAQASASHEAIRYWREALRLCIEELADHDLRRRQINLNQKISAALVQIEGYASQGAFAASGKALNLALDLHDTEPYVWTCTGIASLLSARQEFALIEHHLARVSEEDLQTISATAQARYWYRRGVTDFHLGRPLLARSSLTNAIAVLKGVTQHSDATLGGADLRVTARVYLGRVDYVAGFQAQADLVAGEALTMARRIDQPFSTAWALFGLARSRLLSGSYLDALNLFDESIEISDRYGFVARLGQSLAGRGMAMVGLDAAASGKSDIDKGLDLWRRSSGNFAVDFTLVDAAGTFAQAGHLEMARPYVDEARRYYAIGPERANYAEFFRIDGLLAVLDGDRASGRAKLREAITVAENQGAIRFRLRASHDLARLLAQDGDIEGARKLLAPVYAWFTEGLDAPDLKDAKAFLDELFI